MILLLTTALADLPPPDGYVESCTVERHTSEGSTCRSCSAWHGGREDCEALERSGYTKVCQTRGASTWDEVLCIGGKDGPTPTPELIEDPAPEKPEAPKIQPAPEKKESRCDSLGGVGPFALFPLLALAARRRS
ncbi:MAG: hypothetical protein R3F61_36945 [Myxococcota bacterium]